MEVIHEQRAEIKEISPGVCIIHEQMRVSAVCEMLSPFCAVVDVVIAVLYLFYLYSLGLWYFVGKNKSSFNCIGYFCPLTIKNRI